MPITLKQQAGFRDNRGNNYKCTLHGEPVPCAKTSPPDINNDKLFITKHDIPILDEHDDDFRGDIDEKLLRLIIENTNARIGDDNYVLVTIGHTDPDDREHEYPEIVGYISKLSIGVYDDRPCIVAVFHFKKERFEHAMSFPYRSVERVMPKAGIDAPKRNYIDYVCLLRRKPARSLGLVTYSEVDDSIRVRYAMDVGRNMALDEHDIELVKAIAGACISGVVEGMEAMFNRLAGEGEGETVLGEEMPVEDEGLPGEEMGLEEGTPEEEAMETPAEEAAETEGEAPEEEEKEEYQAAAPAVGGGGNTFVKAPIGGKETEKQRMARHDEETMVARYEARAKKAEARTESLEKQVRDLQNENRRARYSEELTHLKDGLGCVIEIPEELDDIMEMSDERAKKHLEKIKSRYARDPINQDLIETAARGLTPQEQEDQITEDDDVVRYCRDNNLDPNNPVEVLQSYQAYKRSNRTATTNNVAK